jgi:2-keto-4-pentenoate hydratase/2-oxohepta-3-ene-1,7-dioic acid hydratase in catechol pathway
MKICRYEDDRLGIVRDGIVHDISRVLSALPRLDWPVPLGDALIRELDALRPAIEAAAAGSAGIPLQSLDLRSPVANPSKIIGAPVNYQKHHEEVAVDDQLHHGGAVRPIHSAGLFLKAVSSLVGVGDGVALRFPERRNDHEIELAVVIGKTADRVTAAEALSYVAGYSIGLDMTVRGSEERSMRKSVDTYSVLGPYLVSADEIPDPGKLELELSINGVVRQHASTESLILSVPRLIELASSFYTLHPGDVIMTGTPEGVGPVRPGDRLDAQIERIGSFSLVLGSAD